MADNKQGREKQADDTERRQRERELAEAVERGEELEPGDEFDAELDALEALLDEAEFPATTAELTDALGDREIDLAKSQYTVREVLAALDGDSYDSASDVRARVEALYERD